MTFIKSFIGMSILALIAGTTALAQQSVEISGDVTDSVGATVVGASVTITDSKGVEKNTVTANNGRFRINGLAPGKYTVVISSPSFAVYENTEVEVKSSGNEAMSIVLQVEEVAEQVEVNGEGTVSTDPANNLSAVVLKQEDLDALPDDPDDLELALQALAGGGAGPNGGQIYIDGFEGGNLPPKDSIREIRINSDPFSAEYDRMGFGRIEILTKPGSQKWGGQGYFNFNDSAFNARNPFSDNKVDSQRKFYGGSISGPIIKNKASFSLSVDNRDQSTGTSVNATIVDQNFNISPFQQEFSEPRKRFSINPRLDYQISDTNTLVVRYEYERGSSNDFGGGFSLPIRGSRSNNAEHTFQVTETAILNAKTVNETRFQYRAENSDVTGDNSNPAINVLDGFNGGGSTIGLNYDRNRSWDIQNNTTTSLGKESDHAIKFGARLQGTTLEDRTESNYAGTFTFTGFIPNAPNPYDLDGNGVVSSIEQYRAKLLGEADPRFNPSQFSITKGNPLSSISQYEVGLFFKDDWRVNPGLTLSFGLRYENQSNINDNLNFAPRFSFAFSPGAGGAKAPKTVFRGGLGIFYSRFGENLTLQAQRLDGIQQQNFIIGNGNPILGQAIFSLNGVTNVPTADQLANIAPLTSTPRIIASDIQAPYTMQGAFSFERQLPASSSLSIYYTFSRNLHLIRSRNINAPVCPPGFACPTTDPVALQALRPDPTQGNIYQFESSGYATDQRLIFRFSTRFSQKFTMFANYFLGKSKSNSDGSFPAYSYDITDEFSDSSRDTRHTFFLVGSIKVPFGISLSPFIIARSASPFDITSGRDFNGDSIFNDRPTFGQLADACVLNGLTASWCNVSGFDPNQTISRNFGRGSSSLTINLSANKTFGFGGTSAAPTADTSGDQRRGMGGGGRGGHGGGGRGGFGGFGGGGERKPYNLTVGVRVNNLFNTNNVNNPVGNINSSLFGQSTNIQGGFGGGGSRQIEFNTRFRW